MARARGPDNLVARRASFNERADGDARQSYDGMIAQDLGGRRVTSYRAVDDGRPLGAMQLLLRPLSLFLIACTALVIVLTLWAWQIGAFGAFHLSLTPPQPRESSAWMGARRPAPAAARVAPEQAVANDTDAKTGDDEDDASN